MTLAQHILASTFIQDGALFWVRTQRPVDPGVFILAGVEAPACQEVVCARYDLSIFRDRQAVASTQNAPAECVVLPFKKAGT